MGFCGTNTLGGRVGGLMGRWGEGDRDNSGTGTGLCSEYGVEQNESSRVSDQQQLGSCWTGFNLSGSRLAGFNIICMIAGTCEHDQEE